MVPEMWTATDLIFRHFGLFFVLLPPNNLKNQNLKKIGKKSGDIIILQKSPKNHDHIYAILFLRYGM